MDKTSQFPNRKENHGLIFGHGGPDLNLGGPSPPRNLAAQKHQNFGTISDNFAALSRTSPERNKKTALQTTDTPAQEFGVHWSTNWKIGQEFWPTQRVAIRVGTATHLVGE